MVLHTQVIGYQEVQQAMRKVLETVDADGGLGDAVRGATLLLHAYAERITHRWTGTLAASHSLQYSKGGVETSRGIRFKTHVMGRIYIHPFNRSPLTGELAAEYGPKEHRRGGTHAFYKRTHAEAGPVALAQADLLLRGRLP